MAFNDCDSALELKHTHRDCSEDTTRYAQGSSYRKKCYQVQKTGILLTGVIMESFRRRCFVR